MVIKNIESDFCIMDREDNGDKKLKKNIIFIFIQLFTVTNQFCTVKIKTAVHFGTRAFQLFSH